MEKIVILIPFINKLQIKTSYAKKCLVFLQNILMI